MACRRASFASLALLRSSASMRRLSEGAASSVSVHSGQRLAKPGLSGFSSNSSPHKAQTLIGNAIDRLEYDSHKMQIKWGTILWCLKSRQTLPQR